MLVIWPSKKLKVEVHCQDCLFHNVMMMAHSKQNNVTGQQGIVGAQHRRELKLREPSSLVAAMSIAHQAKLIVNARRKQEI